MGKIGRVLSTKVTRTDTFNVTLTYVLRIDCRGAWVEAGCRAHSQRTPVITQMMEICSDWGGSNENGQMWSGFWMDYIL